jgi:hypothetical protein
VALVPLSHLSNLLVQQVPTIVNPRRCASAGKRLRVVGCGDGEGTVEGWGGSGVKEVEEVTGGEEQLRIVRVGRMMIPLNPY